MPGTLLCGGRTSIRTTELPCAFSCVLRPVLCDCGRAKYFRSAAETVLNLPTPSAALRRQPPSGEPLDFRPPDALVRTLPLCAFRVRWSQNRFEFRILILSILSHCRNPFLQKQVGIDFQNPAGFAPRFSVAFWHRKIPAIRTGDQSVQGNLRVLSCKMATVLQRAQ